MKEKVFIVFLTILIVFQLIPPKQPKAVGVDTVVKLVAGSTAKSAVRGIAEKLAIKMSNKQLDDTVAFINKRANEGDPKATKFIADLSSKQATEGSKPLWKKYLLDPMLWLTGADLIYDFYDAYTDALSTGALTMEGYYPSCSEPFVIRSDYSAVIKYNGQNYVIENLPFNQKRENDYLFAYALYNEMRFQIRTVNPTTGFISTQNLKKSLGYDIYLTKGIHASISDSCFEVDSSRGLVKVNGDVATSQPISSITNVDITTVDNRITNIINNIDYTSVTYNLEIEVPEVEAPEFGSDDAWNPPLTEGEKDDVLDDLPQDPAVEPTDKPTGSSWWEWLLKPLIMAIEAIGELLKGIVTAIGDLFIPTDGYFTGFFDGLKGIFDAKLPMIGQVKTFLDGVSQSTTGTGQKPIFNITLPESYGGGTYSVIDLSYFDQYRDWILNFIRFTAWFIFLKRLYARIPKMVY